MLTHPPSRSCLLHRGLPDPHFCIGRPSHLFCRGPPDPPRHPGSSALRLRLGLLRHHLESSAHPPPWLLPPSVPPWVAVMAVAWVPPGSACSKPLLSPSGPPGLFPPSSTPLTLSAGPLPGVCPPPEPPPKFPPIPPSVVSTARGRTFREGGRYVRIMDCLCVFFSPWALRDLVFPHV